MQNRHMDDMRKELLVSGLNNYKWGSLSTSQLLMIVRIIDSMETAKKESADTHPLSGLRLASNSVGVS